MGNAHARHDARGANAARANTDLDSVRARLHQRQRRSACGDVAADHVNLWIVLFDPAHPLNHAFAMAVRGVNHQRIHAGAYQRLYPLLSTLAHAHGSTYAQLAVRVARSVGKAGLFGDVFDRDDALELKSGVDHQQALQLMFVQQRFGLCGGGAFAFLHRDELFSRRHDLADRYVIARLEAQIAAGHNAHHLSCVAHREP